MLPTETRLDPRVKRTRELLLGAFRELLYKKGFESLTVGDITTKATLNRATFYAHFKDKYDLLEYDIAVEFGRRLSQVLPAGTDLGSAHLRQLVVLMCDFLKEQDGRCKETGKIYQPMIENQARQQLIKALEPRIAKQRPSKKISTKLLAELTTTNLYTAAQHWYTSDRTESALLFADRVVPLFESYVFPPLARTI